MIYAASSGTMVAMVDHEVLRGPHAAAAADAERLRRTHSSEAALTWVQSAEQTAWERAHTHWEDRGDDEPDDDDFALAYLDDEDEGDVAAERATAPASVS